MNNNNNTPVVETARDRRIREVENRTDRPTNTPSVEISRDIRLLTEQLNQRNYPDRNTASADINDFMKNAFNLLQRQDRASRKIGVNHLKAVRAQIEAMDSSLIGDKEKYYALIADALKDVERTTGEIGIMSEHMEKKLIDALPTAKTLKGAFLDGISPLIPFVIKIVKEGIAYKKLLKEERISREVNARSLEQRVDALTETEEGISAEQIRVSEQTENNTSSAMTELQLHTERLGVIDDSLVQMYVTTDDLLRESMEHSRLLDNISSSLMTRTSNDDNQNNLSAEPSTDTHDLDIQESQLVSIGVVETNTSTLVRIAEQQLATSAQDALQRLNDNRLSSVRVPDIATSPHSVTGSDSSGGLMNMIMALGSAGSILKMLTGMKAVKSILKLVGLGGATAAAGTAEAAGSIARVAGSAAEGVGIAAEGARGAGLLSRIPTVSKILSMGKTGLKAIPGLGELVMVVQAAFDFFDGFSNAGDILSKGEKDIDIRSKIAAGLGSVVGGLVGIIDEIAGWIGMDTSVSGKKLGEWAKELSAKYWDALFHPIDTYNKIVDSVKEEWRNFSVSDIVTGIGSRLKDIMTFLSDGFISLLKLQVKGAISMLPDMFVPDAIKNWASSSTDTKEASKSTNKDISTMDNTPNKPIIQEVPTDKKVERFNMFDMFKDMTSVLVGNALVPSNTIVAPNSSQTNNVNNVSNNYPSPIQTRNDDISIRTRLGYS